jgi:hypothetical protein
MQIALAKVFVFPPSRAGKFELGVPTMVLKASRLLAGAAALASCALASQAFAQNNPFVPSSQANNAAIEKIVEAKMKAAEERVLNAIKASNKNAPAGAAAGTPGAPGAPGAPVGAAGPLTPGAPGAPGAGPAYPPVGGVPGAAPAMPVEPTYLVQKARDDGTRFLGCINGQHKFMKASGERVAFPAVEINRAIKAGVLPACR